MATIDPNIALGVKPLQVENPMAQYAMLSQLQTGQNQNALAQYQLSAAQRADESTNLKNQLYSQHFNQDTGKLDTKAYYNALAKNPVTAGLIPKEQAAQIELEHKANVNQKNVVDTTAAAIKNIREKASDLQFNPSDDNIRAHAQDAVLHGVWTQAQADQNIATAIALPMNQRPAYFAKQGLDAEKRVVTAETSRANLEREKTAKDTLTETTRSHKVHEDISGGQLNLAKQRLDAELQSTGSLNPAAIDTAAQIWIQTGQLPALGIGKNAGNIKTQILNRATELYGNPNATTPAGVNNNLSNANNPPPFNAENMANQIVGNKMDVGVKTKVLKDFSTGVQGRQVTAFNTAIDHLGTMRELATALENKDVRLFNTLSNKIAKETGQPAPTNFDGAKRIVAAEIVKAIVANGGGVKEREEAANDFLTANSPAQFKGTIDTKVKLLAGQLNSLGLQYENGTGRTDFDKKLTPDAKAAFNNVRGKNTGPVKINGDAEYNALPSGTQFIGPDGQIRSKP